MAIATLTVLAVSDEESRTTMAFTTFVLLQLVNVLAVRGGPAGILGRHQLTNRWVWAALGLVLAVQFAAVHGGVLRVLFDTTTLTLAERSPVAGVALFLAVANEVVVHARRITTAGRSG